jgi:multidrug efflux pump subunit AcrB
MGKSLKAKFRELEAETPIAIQSDAVTTSISSFVVRLIEAIAIVIAVVVLMFAMGFRSSLIIGAILLITVLGTFIFMDVKSIMLERISLGALIIALGMLVDNAIVVVVGIQINSQKGMSKTKAAASIVQQTMWPLFGATVVAVLAFAAIGVSQDSTGEYRRCPPAEFCDASK